MKVLSLIILVCSLCSTVFSISDTKDYLVNVVEFNPNLNLFKNFENYANIIKSITEGDFIVFPESTLTIGKALEVPSFNVTPSCSNLTDDVLTAIACLAKEKNIYIIINIDERVNCTQKEKGCPSTGYYRYNSDVVFGNNGSVVTKYRKWNLFGETGTQTTDEPEIITFDTDKGTFGIFTCFDILFPTPALNLTKKGVKNIIFPTMWFSELPFLTALQAQQMWAYENDVNFFSAGANNMQVGSGGSGIFLGAKGILQMEVVPNLTNGGQYKVISGNITSNVSSIVQKVENDDETDEIAKNLDNLFLKRDDLTEYSSQILNTSLPTIQTQVCNGKEPKFCCDFDIKLKTNATKSGKNSYTYRLVAFSGVRSFSGVYNGGVEICGIVSCSDSSKINSCNSRFPAYDNVSWPVTFENIAITANFTNEDKKIQFPNSLLSSLRPISPLQTKWEKNVTEKTVLRSFKLLQPQSRLLTFAIYGRNFANDGKPVAKPNSSRTIIPTGLSLVIAVVLVFFLKL